MASRATISSSTESSSTSTKSPGAGAPAPATATAKSSSRATKSQAGAHDEWTEELDELGHAFRRVFRGLSRLRGRDTHLGGSEISHAQFELLIELYERGELPAGELATAARLSPGTVTEMLDHLADSGHVERLRSDTDRRVVLTRLTAQGRSQIEAKRAAWRERWTDALQGMGPRDLRAATRVLERLSVAFEDASPTGECPSTAK
jgi:MarR family transcriptional regulator, organic hydroperoxide resistance regulator